MTSAGRAENSSGCVERPRAREIGLIGFAAQIRRSLLTGSYVMETAEHREPCESRGSRTVLGAPGGEIPPGDSTNSTELAKARISFLSAMPPIATDPVCHIELSEVAISGPQLTQEPKLLARKSPSSRYRRPSGATSPAANPPQL